MVLGGNGQKLTDMCGAPFSLAGSFFSWIFHLQPAENSWRQGGKGVQWDYTFIWASLKMSPLLFKL
jgi:hypothetical protein